MFVRRPITRRGTSPAPSGLTPSFLSLWPRMRGRPTSRPGRRFWRGSASAPASRLSSTTTIRNTSRRPSFWFFLAFASADREVGLVDGIFKSWERASRPVTTEVPTVALRDYDVKFNPSLIVGEGEVRAAVTFGSDQLVDARTLRRVHRQRGLPHLEAALTGRAGGPHTVGQAPGFLEGRGRRRPLCRCRCAARAPEQGRNQRGFSHNRLRKGRRPLERNPLRPPAAGCPGAALRQGSQRLGDGLTPPPRQGRSARSSRVSQAARTAQPPGPFGGRSNIDLPSPDFRSFVTDHP